MRRLFDWLPSQGLGMLRQPPPCPQVTQVRRHGPGREHGKGTLHVALGRDVHMASRRSFVGPSTWSRGKRPKAPCFCPSKRKPHSAEKLPTITTMEAKRKAWEESTWGTSPNSLPRSLKESKECYLQLSEDGRKKGDPKIPGSSRIESASFVKCGESHGCGSKPFTPDEHQNRWKWMFIYPKMEPLAMPHGHKSPVSGAWGCTLHSHMPKRTS